MPESGSRDPTRLRRTNIDLTLARHALGDEAILAVAPVRDLVAQKAPVIIGHREQIMGRYRANALYDRCLDNSLGCPCHFATVSRSSRLTIQCPVKKYSFVSSLWFAHGHSQIVTESPRLSALADWPPLPHTASVGCAFRTAISRSPFGSE